MFRRDRSHSFRSEVSFEEYAGKKKDGTLNSQWSKKPATMIRKVAMVQALREAFPQSFAGMYVAEEMGAVEPDYVAGDVIEPQAQQALPQRETVQNTVPPVSAAAQPIPPQGGSIEDEFFSQ